MMIQSTETLNMGDFLNVFYLIQHTYVTIWLPLNVYVNTDDPKLIKPYSSRLSHNL